MKKLSFIIAGLLILLISGGSSNSAAAQTRPPVLAFYYAWFDDATWSSGRSSGVPSPTYRSADPATIDRHVAQAAGVGINAFVQSWYGPQVENNQTETNFRLLLDTATRYQFQAAVDVEVMGPFFGSAGSVQAALATLLSTHVNHPAYFRYNGKPVIFFWRQQRFSPAEWAAIRHAVDPNHATLWIAEGTDLSYQDVFDGNHLYSIAWSGDPQAELNKWPPRLKKIEDRLGAERVWVATAMPGYNDLNLNRSNSFAKDRAGGAFYRQSWAAALSSRPDMIVITSFNEWLEGTQIEPSTDYGDFYLALTRELIAGLALPEPTPAPEPTAAPESAPAPIATTVASPEPQPPAAAFPADGLYRVQSGDTMLGIAFEFDVSVDELVALNGLDSPDRLSIGQELRLPHQPASSADSPPAVTPTPTGPKWPVPRWKQEWLAEKL